MAIRVPIVSEWNPKGLQKAQADIKRAEGGWAKAGAGVKAAALPAAAVLGGIAAGALVSAKAASDLGESVNAVGKVFEGSAGIITDFGKTSAETVGLSARAWNELATATGSTLTNMGADSAEAAKGTVELGKRAADMASVFNTDVTTAMEAINSGLRGEAEPLRKFGVNLSAGAVKAQAMSMGLVTATKNTEAIKAAQITASLAQDKYNAAVAEHGPKSEEAKKAQVGLIKSQAALDKVTKGSIPDLDDHAKSLAAQALIMEQTDKTAGDFADTADGLANKQRTLAAQTEDAKASMGQALLPVMEKLVGLFSKLAGWIGDNVGLFQVIVGIVAAFAAAILVANVALSIYNTISAIMKINTERAAAGQWALNTAMLANPVFLIIVAFIALAALFVLLWKRCETFRKIVTAVFQGFMKVVRTVWDWIKSHWQLLLVILLGPIAAAVLLIVKNWDKIKAGGKAVWDWIKSQWDKIKGWLTAPFEAAWSILSGIFDKISAAIQTVLDLIGKIHIPKLPDLNPFNNSASATLLAAPSGVGVGALGAGVPSLYAATSSGRKTGGGGPTIVVQGAIDPEATARQVNRLLTGHSFRQGQTQGQPRRLAW